MPLTRIWKLYDHWKRQPPTHVLLAQFLQHGEGETARPVKKPGFDFSPPILAQFGSPRPQSELNPAILKSVQELQSNPKYIEWRKRVAEAKSA